MTRTEMCDSCCYFDGAAHCAFHDCDTHWQHGCGEWRAQKPITAPLAQPAVWKFNNNVLVGHCATCGGVNLSPTTCKTCGQAWR